MQNNRDEAACAALPWVAIAHTARPGGRRVADLATVSHAARRRDLDVVRGLMAVGLVLFHGALVFNSEDDFYVRADAAVPLDVAAGPVVVWAMPLLFLIAGFGAARSLESRGTAGFLRERLLRLGMPLLVSLLVLIPFPLWVQARRAGSTESFAAFWPNFFDVHAEWGKFPFVLQGPYFEFGHLWFLVMLLCFSGLVAAATALPWPWAARTTEAMATVAASRGGVLLPGVLIGLTVAMFGMEENHGAWHRWVLIGFYAGGFLLLAEARLREAIRRDAFLAVVAAAAAYLASGPAFLTIDDPMTSRSPLAMAGRAAFGIAGWCAVMAIVGLVDRRWGSRTVDDVRRPSRPPGAAARVVGYLATAALPIYVLHTSPRSSPWPTSSSTARCRRP